MVDLKEVKGLLYLLTHLSPRMCLNLGEFELGVVGVHFADLLSSWGAENLKRRGGTINLSAIYLGTSEYFTPRGASVVITLIISTNWSTPLSPGKIGCPRRSSASTQPADHTSER